MVAISFSGFQADPIGGRVRAFDRSAAPTTATTAPRADPAAARSEAATRLASAKRLPCRDCHRQPRGTRSRSDDAAQPMGSTAAGGRPTAMAATTAGRHAVHYVAPATAIYDATTAKTGSVSWRYAKRCRCFVHDQSVRQGSPGEGNEKEGLVATFVVLPPPPLHTVAHLIFRVE